MKTYFTKINSRYRWLTTTLVMLICLSTTTLGAMNATQNSKLNLHFKDADILTVMNSIRQQTKMSFLYNIEDMDLNKKISIDVEGLELNRALSICFANMNISHTIKDNIIILKRIITPQTQQPQKSPVAKFLKGKVVGKDGKPIAGVAVQIKGTQIGTATGVDGTFVLPKYTEGMILEFRCIGMVPNNLKVIRPDDVKVVMQEDTQAIDNIVVTGMQDVKREHMTGSTTSVSGKELRNKGMGGIDQMLEGMIAGLNSTTITGAPGKRAKMTIRGENNLSGNTEPLWILDGLPMLAGVPNNNTGDYAGTIMQDGVGNVMPEDIESITILKDASAAAIYGAKAANGVIVITTKKGVRSKTQISYSGMYNYATAPRLNFDFMNSEEKLRYERTIVEVFGKKEAISTGRGGYLYKRMLEGYYDPAEYAAEYERLRSTNTNWFKYVMRPSQSHSHNINISGGNEELNYYTSVNFLDQTGVQRNNRYSNAGMLAKLDYRPTDKLIFSIDISANIRTNREHASAVDPFRYAVFANPYERPYDENGNYSADLSFIPGNYTTESTSGYVYDSFNIINEMNMNKLTADGIDASVSFQAQYEPIKGLIIQALGRKTSGYNTSMLEMAPKTYTSYVSESFAKAVFKESALLPKEYNNGELGETSGKSKSWSVRGQIDYSFTIANNHLFSLMGATEISSQQFNNFGYQSPVYVPEYRITGIPSFPDMKDVTYDDMRRVIGGMFNTSDGQGRSASFIGSLRYGFKDRYILNLNYRADGADIIGTENRFTPLWSVGARYNVHKEKWFKNKVLTELAIRGSYGFTGNIDRTAYPFSTITFSVNDYMNDRYIEDFTYPNPYVKWERKEDRNIGVDMIFFDGRINLTVDAYSNKTTDILSDLNTPNSTGRTSVRANGGVVRNDGVEAYINVRWVNTPNVTFSTAINGARNRNVIVKSKYNYDSYLEAIKSSKNKGGVVNIDGKETGSIYGFKVAGVDPKNGEPMIYLTPQAKREVAKLLDSWESLSGADKVLYEAILGSVNNIPDYIDISRTAHMTPPYLLPSLQYLGRSNPLFVGGFNTYFRYKRFEFSTQWTMKTGHIIPLFNDYLNSPNGYGGGEFGWATDLGISNTNRERRYLSFWQIAGDQTNVPRFVTPSEGSDYWPQYATDQKYGKGDYLRMTNLSLSYRLNSEWIAKAGFKSVLLTFNARNLLTFTKYRGIDVGTGDAFGYPVAREYNIKLSVSF